jgi:DNA-binding NarL/FixJ family response regulator
VLLLDMLMPGWNGRVTYQKILEFNPEQKAIIASGYAENEDVRATLEMGAGGFLAKPYTVEALSNALNKTLNS